MDDIRRARINKALEELKKDPEQAKRLHKYSSALIDISKQLIQFLTIENGNRKIRPEIVPFIAENDDYEYGVIIATNEVIKSIMEHAHQDNTQEVFQLNVGAKNHD
jgi:hypothetical protein